MKHYNVVAAIIIHDHKILCMQRGISKYDYISEKFEFSGGKIEKNETNFSEFELEFNSLVRKHFPHWQALDITKL